VGWAYQPTASILSFETQRKIVLLLLLVPSAKNLVSHFFGMNYVMIICMLMIDTSYAMLCLLLLSEVFGGH